MQINVPFPFSSFSWVSTMWSPGPPSHSITMVTARCMLVPADSSPIATSLWQCTKEGQVVQKKTGKTHSANSLQWKCPLCWRRSSFVVCCAPEWCGDQVGVSFYPKLYTQWATRGWLSWSRTLQLPAQLLTFELQTPPT